MEYQLLDIKGNEQIEKYSWREACDIGSSRMDRKHGKYILNVEHSENQPVKEYCRNDWSMWKVFLACLLACVIMTAIGVLIICLVNNKGSANSSIVIQLSTNDGDCVTVKPGTPSPTCPPTMNTTSTVPASTATETTTSTATAATTSTEPITVAPTDQL
ncbi:DYNAP isoform 2 [Pan troglodytes]|uniref:DYNAP isoform 2 n=2 Tax=Pan troglodytes TaxID=9598 RepID=A0A6D2X7I2_PANTR|nr:dynactin-associated protein isoform X2 [Pan troglodytes]XP_054533492.1 dynactin-associated protein isoform X2 [Pan troglodytes]PNI69979.1 DYNAP isoform 2 [Pan troglodytes]